MILSNFSSLYINHRESTLCTSLGGRTSNYITPPNLPPDIQLSIASVAYSDPTLRLLLEQTESPEACYEFAIHQLCLVVAPPCNPNTSAPLLLCPETCLAYDRLIWSGLCDSYVDEIIQTLEKSLLNSFMALANRFRVFNCSDPSTYFQNRTAEVYENSSCTNLFSPNTQGSYTTSTTSSHIRNVLNGKFSYDLSFYRVNHEHGITFQVSGVAFRLIVHILV